MGNVGLFRVTVYNQAAAWAAMIFKLEHLGCTWQVMLFFHSSFTFKIIGTSASDSPACRFLFYLPTLPRCRVLCFRSCPKLFTIIMTTTLPVRLSVYYRSSCNCIISPTLALCCTFPFPCSTYLGLFQNSLSLSFVALVNYNLFTVQKVTLHALSTCKNDLIYVTLGSRIRNIQRYDSVHHRIFINC